MTRQGDGRARLLALRERNELDGERRAGMRARFAAIASRHEDGTAPQAVSGFNLFPTPAAIARRMVELAGVGAGMRVLEPSAGTGRILDALPPDADAVAVEILPELQAHLFKCYPGVRLKCGDFLAKGCDEIGGPFARVVMNPPFQRGTDVRHIMHARTMLAPGGLLVALCYDGAAQRRLLQPIARSWEPLDAGSFRSEGTGAGVVRLTIQG